MSASNHSQKLGLSLWEQTDCPEWADFLQDNEKLEETVGGHIGSQAVHLTAEDREFLSHRAAVVTYNGTGSGAASLTLPFLPRKLTVSAQGKPPMVSRSDGGWDVFSQVWVQGDTQDYGTGGIQVTESTLQAQFSEGAFSGATGLYHALNRSGVTYVVELEA